MSKNVLIITRYFPPGGGIGAFRAANFVKYLPDYGWSPYVVSLPQERQHQLLPDDIDKTQYSSIAEIPEKRFYVDILVPSLNKSLGDLRRIPSFLRRLPQIINENNIDLVFHTAPPFYSLPAVSFLTTELSVPYVIDLRDPWYINTDIFNSTKSVSNMPWSYLNKMMEKTTVDNADKITTATNEMKNQYRKEYPSQQNKFEFIPNGYSPDDYEIEYNKLPRKGDLEIVYPGKFRDNMSGFLEAHHEVTKNSDINIIHFGNKNNDLTKKFYNQANSKGLLKFVDSRGYAEFNEVVEGIRNSDIGLVVTRKNDPTHVPQKTFDYIACDIPILALGPEDSELDRLVKPFEFAFRVDHEDVDNIQAILEFFLENRPKTLGAQEKRQQYTREAATKQLVKIFEESVNT